ncbi:MAG: Rid family detoxifying hydrolase [Parvularculaceae bacterium]
MTRKTLDINNPALDGLPFSPGAYAGGLLYLSGQVGLDLKTGNLAEGGVTAQTKAVLANIAMVLAAAGKSLDDVVKANIYLADMADYAAMNEAYAAGFSKPFPARTCVGVAALPLGAAVEIEVVVA